MGSSEVNLEVDIPISIRTLFWHVINFESILDSSLAPHLAVRIYDLLIRCTGIHDFL